MPHQCVRCGKLYVDGTLNLLKGCLECNGKFFFFIKKESIEKAKKISENLTFEERKKVEEDIKELLAQEDEDMLDNPVFLDIENIRVPKIGRYEIDLIDMFKGKPLVCKIGEGKYIIDLISAFKGQQEKKK